MKALIHPLVAYIKHFHLKVDRHSLQSPYIFELYEKIKGDQKTIDESLLDRRKVLLSNPTEIEITDYGSGSVHLKSQKRKISDITKYSSSLPKYAQLYASLAQQTPAGILLELGTCVGLTASHLATQTSGQIYSFEGAKALAAVAQETLGDRKNAQIITGKIQESLPRFLKTCERIDFALIDAHHAYEPTMHFWNLIKVKITSLSIVVIADIHLNSQMEKAWKDLKAQKEVSASIDFYECGVLLFKKGINKENYILSI
ncbi:hypothetical protein GCM10007049_19260 [Echinicola pacifica]|uniref:Methyltransferase domain-containing protein n=1 Tax=Echinicola pacifica TaxID=346377 RepID=A0A918UQB7_9BACT|nr:class I SAM-dependent methyltransferase [Echinicola pacifica]GGZ26690.1 hypothetical protein GCM10007049_19260 [Echinicola pacifica]